MLNATIRMTTGCIEIGAHPRHVDFVTMYLKLENAKPGEAPCSRRLAAGNSNTEDRRAGGGGETPTERGKEAQLTRRRNNVDSMVTPALSAKGSVCY